MDTGIGGRRSYQAGDLPPATGPFFFFGIAFHGRLMRIANNACWMFRVQPLSWVFSVRVGHLFDVLQFIWWRINCMLRSIMGVDVRFLSFRYDAPAEGEKVLHDVADAYRLAPHLPR